MERAKTMLAEAGLLPEEWGGETPMIPVSAHQGTGINELLETILLVAEVRVRALSVFIIRLVLRV